MDGLGGLVIEKKPTKKSVALAVRRRGGDTDVLLVRRPDDDDEFPGMWGLPAATCRDGEGLLDAARRIADHKLGTPLEFGVTLGVGSQVRETYVIEMSLMEGFLEDQAACGGLPQGAEGKEDRDGDVTMYTAFRWGKASDLAESAAGGSLCSQLLLGSET